MNLYRIRFDGMPYYVEAPSFADAIRIWNAHLVAMEPAGWDGTEQPEEVVLEHDEPVIREGAHASNL
jgi:hypothetical protein